MGTGGYPFIGAPRCWRDDIDHAARVRSALAKRRRCRLRPV